MQSDAADRLTYGRIGGMLITSAGQADLHPLLDNRMTYSEDLRESTLTEREVCQVLADHGCYLGDYLMDRELNALPDETDGEVIADWLGY
jgi:hypothetical protein